MTRDKRTIKFTRPVVSNDEGLQLATPEIAARYIARRLKTDIIADLGCGIGGQVIFFAKECKKVYAVERDPFKLEYTMKNCALYNVKNVEFILGDALSEHTKEMIADADILFSDPARPLSEKERTLDGLEPPIHEILKHYAEITQDFAFHAPPQMPPSKLLFDCEREYMSLNGQLNRLTLYFGALKRCERSAVVLPGESWLCDSGTSKIKTGPLNQYVYEPEPSVLKAELLNELSHTIEEAGNEMFFFRGDERRTLLTSPKHIVSPFLKDAYRVVGTAENDIEVIARTLKSVEAKKVILRFEIEPEKYWKVRKRLENGLTGTRTVHIFGFGNEAVVCEKLKK